jgi:hypothetical protein
MAKPVIYLDNQNGFDTNEGDILSPKATLLGAYNAVAAGGVLVLQEGDGLSYGDLSISKNINIQGAYGSTPTTGNLVFTEAQGSVDNIRFDASGIAVNNTKGAIKVTNCRFENVDVGISLNGVKYVSISKNEFSGYNIGVLINSAEEVNISSNIFYNNGFKSIEVITVDRIDMWRNTIHGAGTIGSPVIDSDENLRVVYKTLTVSDISNKNVPIPGFAVENASLDGSGYLGYDISVNIVEGPSFEYGVDFVGTSGGSLVSWDGYSIEDNLMVGDILRIMYSEDVDPGGGEAVRILNVSDPNSTIDSNNIGTTVSNIDLGVFFNTAIKIRYNNFYGATDNYSSIVTPTNSEGNFSGDPLYTNAGIGDFTLQAGSPNIDGGDPEWLDTISDEITGGLRINISPLDRDIDIGQVNRIYADKKRLGSGAFTGDVGAHEYVDGSHAGDYFVREIGYDRAYYGGADDPFVTLDRAFDPSLPDENIIVGTNYGAPGGAYGRYLSKNLELTERSVRPWNDSKSELIFVTPTYSSSDGGYVYADPDGSDDTGDGSSSSPYRTITKALSSSEKNVVVSPGIYPKFTGEDNKRLIGIPVTKTIPLDWDSYCNVKKVDWNTNGTVSFSNGYISFTDTATINSGSPENKFKFSGDIEAKANVLIDSQSLEFKLISDSDPINPDTASVELVKVDTDLLITFKFIISGVSYSYINVIISFDFSKKIRVSIKIKNGKITTAASAYNFNRSKFRDFSSTYNWSTAISSLSTGTAEVHGLSITADSFTSTCIDVCNSSHTKRKIFAIQGG